MGRDRGGAGVLALLVGLGLTVATLSALEPVLAGLLERQRAQSAADAAALAGVTGGRSAAESVAAANDAVVVGWSQSGARVTVTVEVGGRRATARATDEP